MSFVINPGTIQPPLTAGGVAYGTGSSAKVSAAGTVGQVLTSNGTSTPTWAAASGTVSSVSWTGGIVSVANPTTTPAFTIAGTSFGVPYFTSGTTWASSAAGTTGQVLTATTGGAPTWTTPSPGGSWVYLSTVTANNSATVDIESTINSTYETYAIVASSIYSVTSDVSLLVRQKQNGTYITANYEFHLTTSNNGSTAYVATVGSSNSSYTLSTRVSTPNNTNGGVSFVMYLPNISNTTYYKNLFATGVNTNDLVGTHQIVLAGGGTSSGITSAVTGIRFLMSSGNISTGTFRLYGIKNS